MKINLLLLCESVIFCLEVSILQISAAVTTQEEVDYIASNLNLRYDVITNMIPGHFKSRIKFTNNGSRLISAGNWSIYVHHRFIEGSRLRWNPNGIVVNHFLIKHIKGRLFSLGPADTFPGLPTGDEWTLEVTALGTAICKYDLWPYWYVAAPGLEARTITSTANDVPVNIGPFDSAAKWKRSEEDVYNPYSPDERYQINKVEDLGGAVKTIIPSPAVNNLDVNNGKVVVTTGDWKIVAPEELRKEANLLKGKLRAEVVTAVPNGRFIQLQVGSVGSITSNDGYQLSVDASSQSIQVTGVGKEGVYYGIQSLLALLERKNGIPAGTIRDYPRFSWRGMHMDLARNFHGVQEVLSLLDVMATYKMNRLHLHLTDNEGWRLEIPGIPELTQVGGRRCHDIPETQCVISQLGSGPTTGTIGSGFISVQEYRDILKYADDRYIQVIPEFDMPGHGHAAVAAIRERYRRLVGTNVTAAEEYLIYDLNDTSSYYMQEFTDSAFNPCINSTYAFIEKIVIELKAMHAGIQPLQVFHFGGDEVVSHAWDNSSACQKLAQKEDYTSDEDLKALLASRIAAITSRHNVSLGAWEDGLTTSDNQPYNRSSLANPNIYVNPWDNVWENGRAKTAYLLANAGYKVIMSHATHLYFDHSYEPEPEEAGAFWATRFISTHKTFTFMPDNLYANIDTTLNGNPITKDDICKVEDDCPLLVKEENVIGMQGHVWSETIRNQEQLHWRVYPRLLALAERSWHRAAWESIEDPVERRAAQKTDWRDFANTLGYRELGRLDRMAIQYRVPTPGVQIKDGHILANSAFPGLPIQYSTDGGNHWRDYQRNMVAEPGVTYHFVTKSSDYRRQSRQIAVSVPAVGSTPPVIHLALSCIVLTSFMTFLNI